MITKLMIIDVVDGEVHFSTNTTLLDSNHEEEFLSDSIELVAASEMSKWMNVNPDKINFIHKEAVEAGLKASGLTWSDLYEQTEKDEPKNKEQKKRTKKVTKTAKKK